MYAPCVTLGRRIHRDIGDMMNTQITYQKLDGRNGVALVNGDISDTLQAKRELANWLELPEASGSAAGRDDVDGRLRNGGIAPESVKFNHISE